MLEMQCLMRLTSFIEVIRRIRTVEKRCTDMSKAALVMDMPESCDMCDFVDDEQPPRYGEKHCIVEYREWERT